MLWQRAQSGSWNRATRWATAPGEWRSTTRENGAQCATPSGRMPTPVSCARKPASWKQCTKFDGRRPAKGAAGCGSVRCSARGGRGLCWTVPMPGGVTTRARTAETQESDVCTKVVAIVAVIDVTVLVLFFFSRFLLLLLFLFFFSLDSYSCCCSCSFFLSILTLVAVLVLFFSRFLLLLLFLFFFSLDSYSCCCSCSFFLSILTLVAVLVLFFSRFLLLLLFLFFFSLDSYSCCCSCSFFFSRFLLLLLFLFFFSLDSYSCCCSCSFFFSRFLLLLLFLFLLLLFFFITDLHQHHHRRRRHDRLHHRYVIFFSFFFFLFFFSLLLLLLLLLLVLVLVHLHPTRYLSSGSYVIFCRNASLEHSDSFLYTTVGHSRQVYHKSSRSAVMLTLKTIARCRQCTPTYEGKSIGWIFARWWRSVPSVPSLSGSSISECNSSASVGVTRAKGLLMTDMERVADVTRVRLSQVRFVAHASTTIVCDFSNPWQNTELFHLESWSS